MYPRRGAIVTRKNNNSAKNPKLKNPGKAKPD